MFSFTAVPVKTSNVPGPSSNTSCVDGVDAELRRMIQQVKDVLPQVPIMAVRKDLGKRSFSLYY